MINKNPEDLVSTKEYDYKPIDIVKLWKKLYESKKIIFASTILFSVLAIIYALNSPSIYHAELLMVPAQGDTQISSLASQYGSIASMVGVDLGNNRTVGDTERALAILQSRTFTEQYINEQNLMPILFADAWDEKNNQWKGDGGPPSSQAAHKTVRDMTKLRRDLSTGLISLGIEWTDPQFAAKWANDSISRLNEYIRNQVIEETERNIFFLEEQIQKTSLLNAQTVLYNLIEEQTKNIMLANAKEEYAFKIIDPAVPPEIRIKPKRRQIAMAGFILGFVIGLIVVFAREFFVNMKNAINPI